MTTTLERPPTHSAALPTSTGAAKRWWILAVLGIAQLMVVLDATVVNIALPTAQADLGFSDNATASGSSPPTRWPSVSLLLIGGRIADLFGRKRVFLIGLVGFALASAVGGAAVNVGMLIAARAVQGRLRRAARTGDPVAADHHLHRAEGARQGVRRLRRHRRRAAPRSVCCSAAFLTEYANWRWTHVRQPDLRRRRARSVATCCSSAARRPSGPSSTSPAPSSCRPACSRSSSASRTPRPTAGPTPSPSASSWPPACCSTAFVALQTPGRPPAAAAAHRARPQPRRRLPRHVRGGRRDVRGLPVPDLLPAELARLQRRSAPASRSCR